MKTHEQLSRDICRAVITANFKNEIEGIIRDKFEEYLSAYPEMTHSDICSIMIMTVVSEVSAQPNIWRNRE